MRSMRRRLSFAALLVIGALVVLVPVLQRLRDTPQVVSTGSSNGVSESPLPPLVFARARNIWRVDSPTAPPVQITHVDEDTIAGHPVVSPDGTAIAFAGLFRSQTQAAGAATGSKLFVMNLDGSEIRTVWEPPQGIIGQISWTSDGSAVYVGMDGLRTAQVELGGARLQEIVRVDVASGTVQPFFEDALDPTITPDGRMLAYLSAADSATEERAPIAGLFVTTIDGAQVQQVVDGLLFNSLASPRFSPDGTRIVFGASGGPSDTQQTRTSAIDQLIAMLAPPTASAHGQVWDVWTVNVDGTDLRHVAAIQEDGLAVVFSPDGQEIAAMGAGGIYRMQADGSNLRKIDEQGDHGGLDWLAR